MAPEAPRLLHSPRVIHRGADGAKHSERAPNQEDRPADAQADWIGAERIELRDDEIELPGKIPQDEEQHLLPRLVIGRYAPQNRNNDERERKHRQQRVIRNRGGIGQVVRLIELDDGTPRGEPRNTPGFFQFRYKVSPLPEHAALYNASTWRTHPKEMRSRRFDRPSSLRHPIRKTIR